MKAKGRENKGTKKKKKKDDQSHDRFFKNYLWKSKHKTKRSIKHKLKGALCFFFFNMKGGENHSNPRVGNRRRFGYVQLIRTTPRTLPTLYSILLLGTRYIS